MGRSTPLSRLLAGAGVRPISPPGADPEIRGVTVDSRKARSGDLFFALKGLKTDGESFAPQAIAQGARAIVAASPRPAWVRPEAAWVQVTEPRRAAGRLSREWYGRPDEAMTLVGVTGTNGKTTVTFLVEAIGRAAGLRVGRIGTIGSAFAGVERPSDRTTPEATDFYELLAEMRQAGTELVSLEVSSHALSLGRVEGARFTTAAFLNLGSDHLDFHATPEAYFEAKARLFDTLGSEATAVLPADDPKGMTLAARTHARVYTFGRSPDATVRIVREHCDLQGSEIVLETPKGAIKTRTHLLGRFNIDNVAAASACGIALGLAPETIADGVLSLRRVPGRLDRVDSGQPFAVLVDYAHTAAAMVQMLSAVRELTTGRVIVVFGCGGERDRGKRPEMGRVAIELADRVVLTSDNPRGEDPGAILAEIVAGVTPVAGGSGRYEVIPNRATAIAAAIGRAQSGDAVVIAGKGHETTQTMALRVEHLDDREIARKALGALGWSGAPGAHA